ncbi:MAG: lysine biosynthesis protein LysX [Sulfolobales archaeon]
MGRVSILLLYDVLRWEEKSFIETSKKLDIDLIPVHVPTLHGRVGNDDSLGFSKADIGLQRCVSFYNSLESTILAESYGLDVINNSHTIMVCQDKLWTTSLLIRNKVPVPNTYVAFNHDVVPKVAERLGYPFVIKPIYGSWGRLLALIDDEEDMRTIVEHRSYMHNPLYSIYYIQEFVKKPGRDIRVFTVGDEVPVAIYRYSSHWITNTARGGKAVTARVDPELEEVALRAAKAVKGHFLGIDVFEDPERGYLVNEVNAVTEFRNTVAVTGYDLTRKVLEYISSLVKR